MARGRMIAATVADDKRFNELPIDAALVYLMAIPQLDRDGLILGEPTTLWGQVCRRRVDLIPRMADIIAAWIAAELVTAYKTNDGDTILYFTGFQKNQAMTHYDREAASRFPCPPGFIRTAKGLVSELVQPTENKSADEVRTNSGVGPDKVPPNVMESNVNQSNTNGAPDGVPVAPVPLAERFHSLLAELKETKNKQAKLREIYVLCFGEADAPEFGYLGKVATAVGGAGRLAELFWQYSAKPPTGDVLAYIQRAHKQGELNGTNGGGSNGASYVSPRTKIKDLTNG
jgi:hypothetical protein